jgi:carbonic anhydrase
MRSLALACAVKGGKELSVIGHTDCRVRQVSVNQLIESFRALGINRASLPDNLVEFFGLFGSERQNVMNGVNHIRQSPLISPKIPVHGLIVDIETGRLEWLVNGYQHLDATTHRASPLLQKIEHAKEAIGELVNFNLGDMKFPNVKIGDLVMDPQTWRSEVQQIKQSVQDAARQAWLSEVQVIKQSANVAGGEAGSQEPQAPPGPPPVYPKQEAGPIPIPPPLRLVRNFLRPKK